ncbi:GATA transcription factor [Fusarium beomiforme]|uniref:GATA transcription factor n=1 Tax=Fusarium beomiforme TaxID=44412 RepID=A0A9P5ATL2_9HYPO|nr:GATA transcription factor [Fusarium beomiforme]
MSDPLSVTASVISIVGALLHGSKRLYEFIDSLQSAPKDIAVLSTDLRALFEVLVHITNVQDKFSSNPGLCAGLKAPLENCLHIFDEFTILLQSFTEISRDGTVRVRVWKHVAWAFKDKEVQLFRDTITTYKVSLDMALNAITLFETDFKDEFRDIRSRLQALDIDRVELASVTGCKGSECTASSAGKKPVDTEFGLQPADVMQAQPRINSSASAMGQHTEADQLSTTSPDTPIPRLKNICSKSGFDALKALWLVATRKNPQINLGAIDMSCSFTVCDLTLDDCPIVYASGSFQNLTGYSRYEVIGRSCRFLQAPGGIVERGTPMHFVDESTIYQLKKNVQERREIQMSLINYRKGGQPFLNLLSLIPIHWDTDKIRYYVGFQLDLVESPDAVELAQGSDGLMVNYKHGNIGDHLSIPPQAVATLVPTTSATWEYELARLKDENSRLAEQLDSLLLERK